MADTESPVQADASVISKAASKKGKASPKKIKTKKVAPNHPKVSEMVVTAVTSLKERGGSSLQAIKKYMAANYTVDVDKLAPFIRKYLKGAVTDGTLVQTKGTGASGSFKLGVKLAKKEKPKAAAKPAPEVKKVVKAKKPTPIKKVAKPIKKAEKSPKKAAKSPKKAAKSPKKVTKSPKPKAKKVKSPKKEKKAKSPKKTKSPKPKKAVKKTTKK